MNRTEGSSLDWNEFSQRTWVVIVSGLVFPPLGIFLSWRKPDWTPRAKWIATGLMGLLFIVQVGGRSKNETEHRGDVVKTAPEGEDSGSGSDKQSEEPQSAVAASDSEALERQGYRYVADICEAAERAPASLRNEKWQPLIDIAAEVDQGASSRSPSFLAGAKKAMRELHEGYQYVKGVWEAADRAPPALKKQAWQPLEDLAEEAKRGTSGKSRLFYAGASRAMNELLGNVLEDAKE